MADFYFITSVINMIWQIFTILFVLYRFTSFFNMMYNFAKFVGRLFTGLIYIKDRIHLYITKSSNYSYVNTSSQTTFQKLYNKVKSWFVKSVPSNTTIPLYETRESYINNSYYDDINDLDNVDSITETSSKHDTDFEYHLNNMIDSNYESNDFFRRQSFMTSSLYPPPKRPLSRHLTDSVYEYSVQSQPNNMLSSKKCKSDEVNVLYTPVITNTTVPVSNSSISISTNSSIPNLLSPTPIKSTKKDIFNSDFLVNFLNSNNVVSADDVDISITDKSYISDNSINKTEEHELKMSLLNNSDDNFNIELNDILNDNIV